MAGPGSAMRNIFSGGKGQGGELRSSLRIQRATRGLNCDIKLHSKTKTAQMEAGGRFKLHRLLMLLDTHGPEVRFEGSGPDADHAHDCIVAIMNGERTADFTAEDLAILEDQGRYRREILADLPPQASARWVAWLREDPTRTLPWKDEPLPDEHEKRRPYTQLAGGMASFEFYRRVSQLPPDESKKFETLAAADQMEYLCAPEDVRQQMLDAIPDPPDETAGLLQQLEQRDRQAALDRAEERKQARLQARRDRLAARKAEADRLRREAIAGLRGK